MSTVVSHPYQHLAKIIIPDAPSFLPDWSAVIPASIDQTTQCRAPSRRRMPSSAVVLRSDGRLAVPRSVPAFLPPGPQPPIDFHFREVWILLSSSKWRPYCFPPTSISSSSSGGSSSALPPGRCLPFPHLSLQRMACPGPSPNSPLFPTTSSMFLPFIKYKYVPIIKQANVQHNMFIFLRGEADFDGMGKSSAVDQATCPIAKRRLPQRD